MVIINIETMSVGVGFDDVTKVSSNFNFASTFAAFDCAVNSFL